MAKSYYLLPKAMHFAIFAASSFYAPYLAVFFRYLGFSTVQIGVLTSLFPFVSMLGTMFWPSIADKQRRHRTILLVLMACTVFILIFYTIHPLVKNFAMLLILHLILSFFSSPISSIVDSFVLAILGMNNEKELYGQQRLWAAISWGFCSFLSGIIIDHWPIEFIFYAGAFGYVLSFLLILLKLKYNDLNSILKSDSETIKEMDQDASPKVADDVSSTAEPSILVDIPIEPNEIIIVPSFWSSFKSLLSLQFILFNITVMMIGMGAAVIGNFLFVFLRQDLNASGLLLGVDMIFTVLLELPFFFFGKQLLEKVGIRWMMVAAAASLIIRSFGYCIIPTAWWVLPFELFHGLMFAAFWTAGVQYASDIAPPGLEATAQGVFNASFSLGQGFGALIGGIVYQARGPYVLFFGTGVLGVVDLVFFLVTHRPVDHEKTVHGKHQQIPRNESNAELKTMTSEP